MTRVVYLGPHAAVEISAAGVVVERDVPVDVAPELAAELLEREDWKSATSVEGVVT